MINIWDKKIILHGNTKIKRDFEYLIGIATSKWVLLDIEKGKTYKEVNPITSDYLIVLCEKEKDILFEQDMRELGVEYGQGYVYMKDFFLVL